MRRWCLRCGRLKKLKKFPRNKSKVLGVESTCLKCWKKYRRSKIGKIKSLYRDQKTNCVKRKHVPPTYTQEELIEWCMDQSVFHTLHKKWKKSGYMRELAPSCDRIDDYKGYSFCNIDLDKGFYRFI